MLLGCIVYSMAKLLIEGLCLTGLILGIRVLVSSSQKFFLFSLFMPYLGDDFLSDVKTVVLPVWCIS